MGQGQLSRGTQPPEAPVRVLRNSPGADHILSQVLRPHGVKLMSAVCANKSSPSWALSPTDDFQLVQWIVGEEAPVGKGSRKHSLSHRPRTMRSNVRSSRSFQVIDNTRSPLIHTSKVYGSSRGFARIYSRKIKNIYYEEKPCKAGHCKP